MTDKTMLPEMINSLALVKKAAAIANASAGLLSAEYHSAIETACNEILAGKLHEQFIVDPVQGGAGTSANMNANEVIANRATQLLGGSPGIYIVHPNDHVNMGQSTNDVFPTAAKLTTLVLLKRLISQATSLVGSLQAKAAEFSNIAKLGRTQLQDAVPMHLGQEFKAYAAALERCTQRMFLSQKELYALNMGGTAIGTCINAAPEYVSNIVSIIAALTEEPFVQASDLIDSTQSTDCFVAVSASVKAFAVALSKICNDIRLLSSGPSGGLGEIQLPPRQHGSSIMPGKINPVIPEVVSQATYRVIGNDITVCMASEAGQLELNAFEPVMLYSLFESIQLMQRAVFVMDEYCVRGIIANEDICLEHLMRSNAFATFLVPDIGYERATAIVKRAIAEKRSALETAGEELGKSTDELKTAFKQYIQVT